MSTELAVILQMSSKCVGKNWSIVDCLPLDVHTVPNLKFVTLLSLSIVLYLKSYWTVIDRSIVQLRRHTVGIDHIFWSFTHRDSSPRPRARQRKKEAILLADLGPFHCSHTPHIDKIILGYNVCLMILYKTSTHILSARCSHISYDVEPLIEIHLVEMKLL